MMGKIQAFSNTLAAKPWILALMITFMLIVWMSSGMAEDEAKAQPEKQLAPIPKVKIQRFQAAPTQRTLELYGRTEPDRQANLKAEVAGRIVEVFKQRGAYIKQGELIARIAENDLPARLNSAKVAVKQRELEYKGVKSLHKRGLQDESALAAKEAALADASALVARLKIDLENTQIIAPFDGVLNERHVEIGDYLGIGDPIADVIDLQPLIVRADVPEADVVQLAVGDKAQAKFVDGSVVSGQLRYISSVAATGTNTFKVELTIDNSNYQRLAGISAKLTLATEEYDAIKLSPASLALDESGTIGVKTVVDDKVEFVAAELVKSDKEGIWLAGLGQQADVIVLGQGFVRHGDTVEASEE